MSEEVEESLTRIEGLLVLLLAKLGASGKEISEAMGMNPNTFRGKHSIGSISAGSVKVEGQE